MSFTDSPVTHPTATGSSVTDAPASESPAPPAPQTDHRALKPGPVKGMLALIITGVTIGHQNLLFALSPDVPEGLEIAGYVMATTLAAIFAQFVVIGLAFARSKMLPTAMFGTVGLGLIAQAACPIDGHVSATAPGFIAQVVSWLAYGVFAIWVLGQNRQAA